MKRALTFFLALVLHSLGAEPWRTAEPGWHYEFPVDHHAHPDFKTEWWYFTGQLADEAGHRFGYELTFFRQGIRPPSERDPAQSRFVIGDLKFAHFALTEVDGKRFRFDEKASRGAFGEAGFDKGERIAWIDDWTIELRADGSYALRAQMKDAALRLELRARKAPVIHGENGVSEKSSEAGHGSHYYSNTRLETTGEILLDGKPRGVRGESWFDHEWSTNQLAPDQVGWNWLCAQFDDGTELMLYQMRRADGAIDPGSSGTFVRPDGSSVFLRGDAYRMRLLEFWTSEKTRAKYPIAWRIEVPELQLQFDVRALLPAQELTLPPVAYWEGAVELRGKKEGRALTGRGYLELTGYAGALRELQR